MQFIVTAFDGKDSEAGTRRNDVREQHLEGAKRLIRERKLLYAAAILDDDSNMIGSLLVIDFASKEAVYQEWLNCEPYIKGNVWKDVDIKPCKVPDFVLDTSWVDNT